MSTISSSPVYGYHGGRLIRDAATVIFTILIALLGAAMMTITSSPLMKGASFLWLPAALQLIAGVWLGPIRGFIAGGIGAQAASVIAYGGWAPADFIMNLVASGVANSWLPGVMFRWLRIDPALGSKADPWWRAGPVLLGIVILVIGIALAQIFYGQKIGLTRDWGYVLPLVLLLAVPFVWRSMTFGTRDFFLGLLVAVVSCFLSAVLGTWGAVVGGQTWEAALLAVGVGWFWGDTASAILGLYILAQFTGWAQKIGI